MHNMNWDDMRILDACARQGSFSKAGKALKMDHSSISRRMTQLEADLGVTLFLRTPGGVSLTKAGEAIADQAASMAGAALVAQNTSSAQGSIAGVIRFQTVDATAVNLMGYLGEFTQLYPEIEIHLVLSQDFANLARGEADVVLRATNSPMESYIGQQVAEHAVGVFGTSELLSAHPDQTPLAELPWIAWTDGLTDWWLHRHVPGCRVVMRVSTPYGMAQAVRNGVGVGHLACYGVARDDRFLCLRAPDPELALQIWLLAHRSVMRNRKVRVFMAFLREKIRQDRELIAGYAGSPCFALQVPLRRQST